VQLVAITLDPLRTMGSGFIAAVPNLVFIVILAFLLHYGLRLMRLFFEAIEHGSVRFSGFEPYWAVPTFRMARVIVLAFAAVVAYPYIPGSDSGAFKGVSLFLGVILSLGSSSAVANVIAGYSLTYRRAFKVGQRIRIGEDIGDVVEIRLQVTHLRSLKNEEIIIPNSNILNSHVVNYSSLAERQGLILHTTVGIGYETPWRQVEAMLIQAADRTPGLKRDPAPFVLHQALADFAVTYELNVYTDQPLQQAKLYTALHRNILDIFNEYGVQIMTPAYEGDPEEAKIVPKEKWFELPAQPPGAPQSAPGTTEPNEIGGGSSSLNHSEA
jgi:small-conductance mechanosensitive channel